jgi:hypothetical protein
LFAWLPRDVRLAGLAAIAMLLGVAYEFSSIVAMLLALAVSGVFVALIVGRD